VVAPTAAHGLVVTSSNLKVYAFDESTGKLKWTAPVEDGDDSSPVITPSGVHVSYACPQTYDFDPSDGTQLWHFSGPCQGGGGSTPVLYDGLLYVEDADLSNGFTGLVLGRSFRCIDCTFLRAMYAVLAFLQGYQTWSAILRHTGPWEFWDGVGHSFLGALTLLSLVGIRYPVRMIPLLIFEFASKLVWTLAIYLPLYVGRHVDHDAANNFFASPLESLSCRCFFRGVIFGKRMLPRQAIAGVEACYGARRNLRSRVNPPDDANRQSGVSEIRTNAYRNG
jgi:hypothetical protein